MLHQLPTLSYLIKVLQHVPYVASKDMYRVAIHFLYMNMIFRAVNFNVVAGLGIYLFISTILIVVQIFINHVYQKAR